MIFFKNLVLALGALNVGLGLSVAGEDWRQIGSIHLFGNSSCKPYDEYFAVLAFASLAKRLAIKSSEKCCS